MKFSIAEYLSIDVKERGSLLTEISQKLEKYFADIPSLLEVKSILIGIIHNSFDDLKDGEITELQLIKREFNLEYNLSIEVTKVSKSLSDKDFKVYVLNEILNSLLFVSNKLEGVSLENIIKEFKKFIQNFESIIITPDVSLELSATDLDKELSKKIKLKDNDFWKIIEQADSQNIDSQLKDIKLALSKLSDNLIFDFELQLRQKLKLLTATQIQNVANEVLKGLTDDTFLYFRCRLILQGRDSLIPSYHRAEMYSLFPINFWLEGEKLLSVADDAFKSKNNNSIILDDLPRLNADRLRYTYD